MISHRHAEANNPYIDDYDEKRINAYIIYLDANNLYGHSMSQKLPTKDFIWKDDADINYIKNFDVEGNTGCFVECDLTYPEGLHDLHNSYPLAVESKTINYHDLSNYQKNQLNTHNEKHNDKIAKLIPNFNDKKNYIVYIKNLKYYLSKGLVLTKIHKVLEFTQTSFLKSYIDFNTNQRTKSKNEFEKDMYKLMNNAVFGKTMENVRGRVNIELLSDKDLILKHVAKPQFLEHKIYGDELVAIKEMVKKVELNKAIYVGVAVLDLSKLHMYSFHYDYIMKKYGNKATLLFTDTDSLCYHIETDDIYKDMKENKEEFDFSDYKGDGYMSNDNTNKKVIGKFTDETKGVPIKSFVGLRSKCYSVLLANAKNDEKKTLKGIKKTFVKNNITHADYKKCLFGTIYDERQQATFTGLRSNNHIINLYNYTKTS